MFDIAGVTYTKPKVTILQQSPLLVGEYAGRTAYDSFSNSEHECIRNEDISNLDVDHSNLLDSLAWVHHHHSVLEHLSITYLIKGTSRGTLQEIVRHRIASYTVRSTRYTMQDILHTFNACVALDHVFPKQTFVSFIKTMNVFMVKGDAETMECEAMYDKLLYQFKRLGTEDFIYLTMSKSAKEVFNNKDKFEEPFTLFNALKDCKSKRNVGDNFKWIVTDNWKVDLVATFNLRSLKNFFELRASNAAYFQIQWLAEEMVKATSNKYLDLVMKKDKINKIKEL